MTTPLIDGFGSSGYVRSDPDGHATILSLPGGTTVRAVADNLAGEVVVQTQAGQTTEAVIELKPVRSMPSKK